ncbi:MAG: hypothetical protein HRT38_02790 [Alteromonadaceae bacterium]|nr:hypothetical protein [Alteromonadaceae bacterium]
MFEFQIEGLDDTIKRLDFLEREQLPFAFALTVTRTAQDVQRAEKKLIATVFDNPKSYTKNSVYIKSATKRNPVAAVWLKDASATTKGGNAAEYLSPHIFGGARKAKRFEQAMRRNALLKLNQFTVPAKSAKRDRFGNISQGQIGKLLSNLGAKSDRRQNSKRGKNAIGSYFLFENDDGSLSGVWQRTANGILPFLLFMDKAPVYRKRFPFYEMANRTINKRMEKNFHIAMDYAFASSLRMRRVA